MLVCHCHAITDREIRDAVRTGAASAAAVGAACGAGTGCGGCRELVELVVRDEHGGRCTGPHAARELPLLAETG